MSHHEINNAAGRRWTVGKTVKFGAGRVEISKPLCVGRSPREFWYPNIMRFPDGTLAVSIRTGDDRLTEDNGLLLWSKDGGQRWSEPKPYTSQSFSYLPLPSGEFALLPHHLYEAPGGCRSDVSVISRTGGVKLLRAGVTVTGFTRPFGGDLGNPPEDALEVAKHGRVPLSFNGIPLRLENGTFLTVLYGVFNHARRYTALVAESRDGFAWRIRSVVADDRCSLSGAEGPCEACLCALPDGQLTCVFRRGWETYGQSWSADEGKTWGEPVAMKAEGKVEPKLLLLQSGTVALAGGRPGFCLWLSREPSAATWHAIDMLEHHNAFLPEEVINRDGLQELGGTSSYTGIVEIEPNRLLYVYDRVPDTFRSRTHWEAGPAAGMDIRGQFSVYVVQVTVSESGRARRCDP